MHFIHVYVPFNSIMDLYTGEKHFQIRKIPKYQTHCLRRFFRYSEISTVLFTIFFLGGGVVVVFLEMQFVAI